MEYRPLTVPWRWVGWLWAGLPILGTVPGSVPTRVLAQGFQLLTSLLVIGLGMAHEPHQPPLPVRRMAGWMVVGLWGITLTQLAEPVAAISWAMQATVLVVAAATLAQQNAYRWLREAVIVCAWAQVIVCALQGLHVPLPWPQQPHGWCWGTVGSNTLAAIVIGLGALWSDGWPSWGLMLATVALDNGTVFPMVCLFKLWPFLRKLNTMSLPSIGLAGLCSLAHYRDRLLIRLQVWRSWQFSGFGHGFQTFPSGFQDDTALGHALGWRDYHNVALDWIGRFGLPGAVALGALVWWLCRASHRCCTVAPVSGGESVKTSFGGAQWPRRTCWFALWVSCWQSAEQFPVLIGLGLIGCVGLWERGGTSHAMDSL